MALDWVGTTKGKVFSVPAGALNSPENRVAWSSLPAGIGEVSGILQDPTNPDRIYVTPGAPEPSIYRSVNAGASFQAITPSFAAGATFTALSINPYQPTTLYLGVITGTVQPLRSDDDGKTWTVNSWPPGSP